jgi:hypothetical protein
MKKFKNALVMLLIASMLASSAGCSKKTTEQTTETVTTETTYGIGTPEKTDDFEFGVNGINSFEVTTEYGEKFRCLLVNVSYTNLTDKEKDISNRNIELYLDNEQVFPSEYRDEFELFFEEGLLFNDKNVNPGRTKRGYIVYRIYKDFSKIDVCMDSVVISANRSEVTPLAMPTPTETPAQATESSAGPTG